MLTVDVNTKLRVMKFDGDDMYSYAVFRANDVKGMRSPVFFGQAQPIQCSMSKMEADYFKRRLENRPQ
jgi:hypothetical protein